MYTVTPIRIAAVLAFYAGLFTVIRTIEPSIDEDERRPALLIGGGWAFTVFIANYLLFRAGVISFLPWVANFMHTFLWIGLCLTPLYLGVRRSRSMAAQFVIFATFSLAVKVVEQRVFGTWDLGHFFHVFQGNAAYVLGWSLADGLYPPITYYGLMLLRRVTPAAELA